MNRTLVPITYNVQGLDQTVWASNASSTDHDQTGEIIWPISVFLAWFVASQGECFRGHHVIELGAGCAGLPGLIASRFAAGALLTDGNESVLKTLRRNVAETIELEKGQEKRIESSTSIGRSSNSSTTPKGTTSNSNNGESSKRLEASSLVWGDKESVQAVLDDGWRPQILLGADIVCWIDFVIPLLQTVKCLFLQAAQPLDAVLYLGFVNRANATERLLYSQANEMGMRIVRVPAETFLPSDKEDWPAELRTTQKLELLTIKLDPTLDGFDRPVRMDYSDMVGRATPC